MIIDIKAAAAEALGHTESILNRYLPGGKLSGREYQCANLSGGNGSSCNVNTTSGRWSDFATGETGGDLVALIAAIKKCSQLDAAKELAVFIGHRAGSTTQTKAATVETWAAIVPVPADAPAPPPNHYKHGTPAKIHTYLNNSGQVIQYIYRYESPSYIEGKKADKKFFPLTFCHNESGRTEWRWQALPENRPLYGLELLRPDSKNVVVVEGEKACEAARRIFDNKVLVLTWSGGGSATTRTDWSPVKGMKIYVWPDADEAGFKTAISVAEAVTEAGAVACKIMKPPADVCKGFDLADAESEGWDFKQVFKFIEKALTPEEFKRLKITATPDIEAGAKAKIPKKLLDPAMIPVPDILTDQRIKYYFANSYASLVQYVPGIGWHYWDGRRWCTNMAGGLHAMIDQMQRHLMESALLIQDEDERMKRRKSLLGLEMHRRQLAVIQACQTVPALITESSSLDSDKMLFNTLNGTLDLRTGTMHLHNPADMITRISSIEYDAEAECPVFIKFITWAMCGDVDTVAYLQRFIGYCLTGQTTEQKLVFMYGLGKNGKTTLINVIQELLGDYSSNADTTLIMKSNNGSDGNRLSMLAGIRGARAVTLSEVNDGQQLDAAAIKSFTGGDTITCRHLYEGFFSYTPQAKLIGFGNYKPHIKDTDHGIWRRIELVPFRATCADEDTDSDLPNKLRAELPGILAWAVRGCLDWQRIGLAAPEAIRNATNEYRQAEDIFASWLGECCGVSPHRTALSTPLLESFKEFSGWRSTSHKKFGNMLTGHGFKNRKSNGKSYWDGLDLQFSDDSDFRPPFSEKSYKKEDLKSFPEYPPKVTMVTDTPFFDGREFHADEGDFL